MKGWRGVVAFSSIFLAVSFSSFDSEAHHTHLPLTQTIRLLDAMVTAIRIQRLPKSCNPASIADDSRGNGTARTESIASVVRAIANAMVNTLAYLCVTNIDIPISAPKV